MNSARFLWVILAFFVSSQAHAGAWMICNLEARVIGTIEKPFPAIRVTVMSVHPQSDDAECPSIDDVLTFEPERPDYQTMLPRRNWPHAGKVVKFRYMYLDGICKNDGNERPCRIKHYPQGW